MPELSIIILFALIIATSIKGFRDPKFFSKYMFDIHDIVSRKENYRLLSCGFLHIDWMHLIFNMITLYFFYSIPFEYFGEIRFFILYALGLVISSVFSLFVNYHKPSYTAVGASGAVTAVLFSAIILSPDLKLFIIPIPIPIPGYVFAIAYLLYTNYGMKHSLGNIGHSAHLGGAAAGVVITILMDPTVLSNSPIIVSLLAVLVLGLIVWELISKRRN